MERNLKIWAHACNGVVEGEREKVNTGMEEKVFDAAKAFGWCVVSVTLSIQLHIYLNQLFVECIYENMN